MVILFFLFSILSLRSRRNRSSECEIRHLINLIFSLRLPKYSVMDYNRSTFWEHLKRDRSILWNADVYIQSRH